METPPFTELIHTLGACNGTPLSCADVVSCHLLGSAFKRWSARQVARLSRLHADDPQMFIMIGDGWACDANITKSSDLQGSFYVRRKGKLRAEFLLQAGILKVMRGGNPDDVIQCMKVSDPIGLGYGRTAWHVFTATTRFCPVLRHLGARRVTHTCYLFDGALHEPLRKANAAKHELFYNPEHGGTNFDECHDELRAMDWCWFVKCWQHSASNSISWALAATHFEIDRKDDQIEMIQNPNHRTPIPGARFTKMLFV